MDTAQVTLSLDPAQVSPIGSSPATRLVENRDVLSCPHCRLVQYRTLNTLCRRCRKELDTGEEHCAEQDDSFTDTPTAGPHDASEAIRGLGARVRHLRKGLGLTQRSLSERMGVPRRYASRVELGCVTPSLATLKRIAAALEASIWDLLHDKRNRREEEIAAVLGNDFVREIAISLPELTPLHRALILREARDAASDRSRS